MFSLGDEDGTRFRGYGELEYAVLRRPNCNESAHGEEQSRAGEEPKGKTRTVH